MHVSDKIEDYSFEHGRHVNNSTKQYFQVLPHDLGRPLTHDEMDYNLLYQAQTINGFRIFGSGEDAALTDSDLNKVLKYHKISTTDADYSRYVELGYSENNYIWIPVEIAAPTTTTTTTANPCIGFTVGATGVTPSLAYDNCSFFEVGSAGTTPSLAFENSGITTTTTTSSVTDTSTTTEAPTTTTTTVDPGTGSGTGSGSETTTTTTTEVPTTTTTTISPGGDSDDRGETTTTTTVAQQPPITSTTTTTVQQMGPALPVDSSQTYEGPASYWNYNAVDSNGDYVHDDCAVVNSFENPSLGTMTGNVITHIRSQQNGLNFQLGDTMEWWSPTTNEWRLFSNWYLGPNWRAVYTDNSGRFGNVGDRFIVRIENDVLVQLESFDVACPPTTTTTTTEAPTTTTTTTEAPTTTTTTTVAEAPTTTTTTEAPTTTTTTEAPTTTTTTEAPTTTTTTEAPTTTTTTEAPTTTTTTESPTTTTTTEAPTTTTTTTLLDTDGDGTPDADDTDDDNDGFSDSVETDAGSDPLNPDSTPTTTTTTTEAPTTTTTTTLLDTDGDGTPDADDTDDDNDGFSDSVETDAGSDPLDPASTPTTTTTTTEAPTTTTTTEAPTTTTTTWAPYDGDYNPDDGPAGGDVWTVGTAVYTHRALARVGQGGGGVAVEWGVHNEPTQLTATQLDYMETIVLQDAPGTWPGNDFDRSGDPSNSWVLAFSATTTGYPQVGEFVWGRHVTYGVHDPVTSAGYFVLYGEGTDLADWSNFTDVTDPMSGQNAGVTYRFRNVFRVAIDPASGFGYIAERITEWSPEVTTTTTTEAPTTTTTTTEAPTTTTTTTEAPTTTTTTTEAPTTTTTTTEAPTTTTTTTEAPTTTTTTTEAPTTTTTTTEAPTTTTTTTEAPTTTTTTTEAPTTTTTTTAVPTADPNGGTTSGAVTSEGLLADFRAVNYGGSGNILNDVSGNNFHLNITGATYNAAEQWFSGGDTALQLNEVETFSAPGPCTIEGWFRTPTELTGNYIPLAILGQQIGLKLRNNYGQYTPAGAGPGVTLGFEFGYTPGGPGVGTGWNHLAITYSEPGYAVWLNGTEVLGVGNFRLSNMPEPNDPVTTETNSMWITNDTGVQWGQVRFYNQALTSTEINSNRTGTGASYS